MTTPIAFLREATKAVPAVKYALGVGGIVAAVAIVYSFQLDPRVAFVGTIITLVLMGVLVIFARMAALTGPRLHLPVQVFTWFVLVLFMVTSIVLFSSVFFQKPLDLACWLTGPNGCLEPVINVKDDLDQEQKYELIKLSQAGCYFFIPGEAKIASVTDYMEIAQEEFANSLLSSNAQIRVHGYIETGYTGAYALMLSERRADAVKQILISRYSIDASRIVTEGHGMKHNQNFVRQYFCGARVGS